MKNLLYGNGNEDVELSIKDKFTVKQIQKHETYEWILKKHYAKRKPSISWAYGLFADALEGVCTFGSGANRNMKSMVEGYDCIELNRLITNEQLEENVLSYFVSRCLKMLPRPTVVVSYADQNNGHNGYIYQATNWVYTGQGTRKDGHTDTGVTLFEKDGKEYHAKTVKELIGSCSGQNAAKNGFTRLFLKPKHRYFYFIGTKKEKKEMAANLPYPILPYPKGENQKYDASHKPNVQMALF